MRAFNPIVLLAALPAFVSAAPTQSACNIIRPDAIYTITPASFPQSFPINFVSQAQSPSFVASSFTGNNEVVSIVKYTIPTTGPGPTDLKFYIANKYRIHTLGNGQLNAYVINPTVAVKDLKTKGYLFGTTTFSDLATRPYPASFEVNQLTPPKNGQLWVMFTTTATNSEVDFYQDNQASGLFIFKGDCWGTPVFN